MALGNAFWKWNFKEVETAILVTAPRAGAFSDPRPLREPSALQSAAQAALYAQRAGQRVRDPPRPPSLEPRLHSAQAAVDPLCSRTRARGGARRETAGWSPSRQGGDARAHQRFLALRVRARRRPAAALCGSGVGARHGGGRGQAGLDPDLNASISLRAVGLAAGCA